VPAEAGSAGELKSGSPRRCHGRQARRGVKRQGGAVRPGRAALRPPTRLSDSSKSVLPGIAIIRILLLPPLDIVLLVLHCVLAHLMLIPFMSGNASPESPEDAMTRHMTCQGPRSAAR
jgi:hypothetical protein